MRRRELVGGLGATLPMWPLVARGQGGRLRKIGVVMNFAAFLQIIEAAAPRDSSRLSLPLAQRQVLRRMN
jgi:hypothetical protein